MQPEAVGPPFVGHPIFQTVFQRPLECLWTPPHPRGLGEVGVREQLWVPHSRFKQRDLLYWATFRTMLFS